MDRGAERHRRSDPRWPHDAELARDDGKARERNRDSVDQRVAECGREPRRPPRPFLGRASGGLLLQNLSLAALGNLRADGPPHGRIGSHRSRQSAACRQSDFQRPLRSARGRRGPRGARGGERGGKTRRGGVPRRGSRGDRRPASPSRRDDRRRRRAHMGGGRTRTRARERRARPDLRDRFRNLRPQSRAGVGAARARRPTRSGASGRSASSSRRAPSSARSSCPTTTGRA